MQQRMRNREIIVRKELMYGNIEALTNAVNIFSRGAHDSFRRQNAMERGVGNSTDLRKFSN